MDKSTIFSKTGKGLLEIKNKSRSLSRDLFKLLNLIDGRSGFDDLQEKFGRVPDKELLLQLRQLSDLGFIKEVVVSVQVPPPPGGIAAVDDLDFTSLLGAPRKPGFYTSAQTEQRAREESERKTSETNATRAREDAERSVREQAEAAARQVADKKAWVEAEVRARAEAERQARGAAELRARQDAEQKLKLATEAKTRDEAERRALFEEDTRRKLDAERQRVEAERKRADEQARLAADAAERKRIEDEARKAREEAERISREEAERKRREEEARKAREAAERIAREEAERKRVEEVARKAREEAERIAREEAERKRREEEERQRIEAEARKAREEAERIAREEAERKRREEEERKRIEAEARKAREEAERIAREETERKRFEEEARRGIEEDTAKARAEAEQRDRAQAERARVEGEARKAFDEADRLAREEAERNQREADERKRLDRQATEAREAAERREYEEADRRRLEAERERELAAEEQQRRSRGRVESEARVREETEARLDREREQAEAARREQETAELAAREETDRRRREDDERVRLLVAAARGEAAALSARAAGPEAPGVQVLAGLVEPAADPLGLPAMAEIDLGDEFGSQEDALRQALEEEEMRLRLEEQAREAMEQAEREEVARREAESRAIAEAAQRAREREEQRERDESARRQKEEAQRKASEREERRAREEDARRKAESAKLEADRRQREEALATQRAEQEERDRQKAKRAALLKSRQVPPWRQAQSWVIGFVVLVVGLLAALQFMPMSSYIPTVQGIASRRIGEPVTIAEMRMSVVDGFEFRFDGIRIGKQLDIQVRTAKAQIELSSLLGDHIIVKRIVLEGASANADVLSRVGNWPRNAVGAGEAEVRRVLFRDTTVAVPDLKLPTFDAEVLLAPDGTFRTGSVKTSDGSIRAEITRAEQGIGIDVTGRGFTMFAGPPVVFDDLVAKGTIAPDGITLASVDGRLYGGTVTGNARLTWNAGWRLEGDFETTRVELFPLLATATKDATSSGQLDTKVHFQMTAPVPGKLFGAPQVQAGFNLHKGNVNGVDLVRALQSQSREGVRGGRSRFDELGGTLTVNNGRYQYRNLRLQSGLLVASGQFEIAADQNVSGRLLVELKTSGNQFRGNYGVLGSLKNMMLKP